MAMFTRRARYVAAVLVVAGVGAALALPSSPGKATEPTAAAAYCGLVACSVLHSRPTATVPAGDPSPAPRSRPVSARRPAPTPAPTPVPASTPSATPAPTPKPSPAPTSTGVPVTGDQVDTVWNAEWHQGGGIVTMTAASYDQMIEPGGVPVGELRREREHDQSRELHI
jgi:hypothetical protein